MPYSTLISFYGPKPRAFGGLIGDCQEEVAKCLGAAFRPYDLRQVHCTIASLDRIGDTGIFNASFLEFRDRRVEMDLAGLTAYLGSMGGIQIRIGGFAESDSPFVSRGQSPYQRSFSMQDGKAVVMGWPMERSGQLEIYPPRLDSLRRELQRFGILHRYHASEADIDNDFYLRIGLYDPARIPPAAMARVEHRLREFLSHRPPVIFPLGLADLALAQSDHVTLPPATTTLLPLSTPAITARSIAGLFGWADLVSR
jgi:hypothetical protein